MSDLSSYSPDPLLAVPVNVLAGQTLSEAIDCKGLVPVALATPSALTSTSTKIQAGNDEDALLTVADSEGTDYAITLAASKHVLLSAADFSGIIMMRLLLGTAEAEDRTFHLYLRKLG